MKVLFLILLASNLAYAGWSLLLSPQAPKIRQALFEKRSEKSAQVGPAASYTEISNGDAAVKQQTIELDETDDSAATCWMLGPFDDEQTALILQERLLALGVELQLKSLATPVAPDYWVYIEPRMSRPAALRLLRELQSSQIDSFIIGEGELENGISLGFFPDEKTARKVQRARADDGYSVKIKSVVRNADEWWAVMPVGEYSKLQANQWRKLQRELGQWQQRQNYCKLIASAKELE